MMSLDFFRRIPTIIFDLDGTVTDFQRIDNKIIQEIFKDKKCVLNLDKIAWKINEQDLIKNTTLMLKLRLLIYALLSGIAYQKVMTNYSSKYVEYTREDVLKHKELFSNIKQKGYHVIVLSNNKLVDELLIDEVEICSINSKFKWIKKLSKDCDIILMIGNNFMDDIIPAYLFKIKYKYVGDKLKFIKNNRIKDISDILKDI